MVPPVNYASVCRIVQAVFWGHPDLWSDCAQDVSLKLHMAVTRGSFRVPAGGDPAKALDKYTWSVARNLYKDVRRAGKRAKVLLPAVGGPDPLPDAVNPPAAFALAELVEHIDALLTDYSGKPIDVMIWRTYRVSQFGPTPLTLRDVTETLGLKMAVATVWKAIHRVDVYLQPRLNEWRGGG
jgi:hypothetical protein